ncbi:MAG: hypothetical protein ACRYG8_11340 [Janthinobacterium lividum]
MALEGVGHPRAVQRPETVRVYAAEWIVFVAWCRAARRVSLPADGETLAAYLVDVAPGVGRGTVGRKRAAIRAMHRQHGLPLPALDSRMRAAIRGAAEPKRRAGPSLSEARSSALWVRLAMQCPRDLAGLRDRALLLLAADGQATIEDLLGLEREQVRLTENGAELRLVRETPLGVTVPRGTAACPVRAMEEWLQASETRFGPVFRKVDRWGNVEHARLGPDGLRRIIARRQRMTGQRSKAG